MKVCFWRLNSIFGAPKIERSIKFFSDVEEAEEEGGSTSACQSILLIHEIPVGEGANTSAVLSCIIRMNQWCQQKASHGAVPFTEHITCVCRTHSTKIDPRHLNCSFEAT
jgi:hypothetical protein